MTSAALLALETVEPDTTLVDDPPKYEEIERGLRRYLEVAPSGPHVAEVKKMIESIAMAKVTG